MIIGNKYWILTGSNGASRLHLGELLSLKYNNRDNVTEFKILNNDVENKYFSDKMFWNYDGETVCTYGNEFIFEYDDLDKAYLAWLKSYGLNISELGNFIETQIKDYPERLI